MPLFDESKLTIISREWNDVARKIKDIKNKESKPSLDQLFKYRDEVLKFISKKKLLLYGGYAQESVIKKKDKSVNIYDDYSIADIDVYSSDPVNDLIELSFIFYDSGEKYVSVREAMHKETYTLFVDFTPVLDITYMPKHIFNTIPYIKCVREKYEVLACDPLFLVIDLYRILSDPLISYWRMDLDLKPARRFHLLEKYYPLSSIVINDYTFKSTGLLNNMITDIDEFMKKSKSCLYIGERAYKTYYKYCSETIGESVIKETIKEVDKIQTIEIVSADYENDLAKLEKILSKYDNISSSEHYPFFQFTGVFTLFFHANSVQPLLIVYDCNKKSIPYVTVGSSDIKYGSLYVMFLYMHISYIYNVVNKYKNESNKYICLLKNLDLMQGLYYEKYKDKLVGNNLMSHIVIDTIGELISPDREMRIERLTKKEGKKVPLFSFTPSEKSREIKVSYTFSNISGNAKIKSQHKKQ